MPMVAGRVGNWKNGCLTIQPTKQVGIRYVANVHGYKLDVLRDGGWIGWLTNMVAKVMGI